MIDMVTTTQVTIGISGIELLALKKLSLISHALAGKIAGRAGEEQTALATVLDDVVRRLEVSRIKP